MDHAALLVPGKLAATSMVFALEVTRKTLQKQLSLSQISILRTDAVRMGGLHATRDEAELLFIFALACQASSAAGFGCGAQDIATRYSSLIYGVTSALAVVAGASGQYFTGWCLDQTGRDFAPVFALVVAVELVGLIAWNRWWSSERTFD